MYLYELLLLFGRFRHGFCLRQTVIPVFVCYFPSVVLPNSKNVRFKSGIFVSLRRLKYSRFYALRKL